MTLNLCLPKRESRARRKVLHLPPFFPKEGLQPNAFLSYLLVDPIIISTVGDRRRHNLVRWTPSYVVVPLWRVSQGQYRGELDIFFSRRRARKGVGQERERELSLFWLKVRANPHNAT